MDGWKGGRQKARGYVVGWLVGWGILFIFTLSEEEEGG